MATMTKPLKKIDLRVTTDYKIFKSIHGNRPVDKGQVHKLKNKIENEGNLTSEFPINVNEKYEVIDGQHRIVALRELGYPVYYTISTGANLNTVRNINVARRNWTWLDYAKSYASDGNPHYKDLLSFYEAFGFRYSILSLYTQGGKGRDTHKFQAGDYKVLDRVLTFKLLGRLRDIREAIPFNITSSLASAMYDIMTHTNYDHPRMIKQLTNHGSYLREWRVKKDWLRNLEDVYNLNYATKERFF